MIARVALLALLAHGAVAFAPVSRTRGVVATRPRSTPEAVEEPGNPLSKLFEREPEEPEPPAPEEPELARVAPASRQHRARIAPASPSGLGCTSMASPRDLAAISPRRAAASTSTWGARG